VGLREPVSFSSAASSSTIFSACSALLTVHFFSSGEEFFMRASTGGNLQSAIRNPQSAIGLRAKPAPSALRALR
jgi:hypothetical protein